MAKRNNHESQETVGWKTSLTRPQKENLDSVSEDSVWGPFVIHDCVCLNVSGKRGENFLLMLESKSIARSSGQSAHVQKVLYALYILFSKKPQNFAGKMQNNNLEIQNRSIKYSLNETVIQYTKKENILGIIKDINWSHQTRGKQYFKISRCKDILEHKKHLCAGKQRM